MKTRILIINLMALMIAFSKTYTQDSLTLIATMTGEKNGDLFSVVAGVSDVNGDGYDDVLVGAPGGNYARLYFGGSPFDTLNFLKLIPDQAFTFGESVAGGGDLNGDGFADFIIGAPQSSVFEPEYYSNAGKVFVYLGGSAISNKPYLVLKGAGWRYDFGKSVAFAGDVNNDGYDDIIIGAPNDEIDAHGRVYIYFGGAEMDSIADVFIEGQEGFDMLGWSVAGAGDVNMDGFNDVIIGAPQDLKGEAGKAYLFYGGEEIGFENSLIFSDENVPDYGSFGRIVSGLGDINNDSFDDFGIMAIDYIKVISGKTTEPLMKISASIEWWAFQFISDKGDINSDGYCDLLIGIGNRVSQYAGMVAIYLGSTNPDTIPDYQIEGQTPHYYFGYSIDFVGDINNDGFHEIIIGEQQYFVNRKPGKVYIYSYYGGNKVKEKNKLNFQKDFQLYQNYPNPFNSYTTISYNLYFLCFVRVEIYNFLGQKIKTLISTKQNSGSYNIIWNGKDLNDQIVSSGIYFVKMTVKSINMSIKQQTKIQKAVLIK